jgi:dTDP-4-dehydrorhamnose reductase
LRVLVTGAGGMLGRDLVSLAEEAGHDVTGLAHDELDITDAASVEGAVRAEQPEAVINSAAWTDVDGAEDDLEGALAVNETGASNVAAAAAEVGAKVIFPSTDYVFDGSKNEPWLESDGTNPLGAYGRSKLAGEIATAKHNPRHFIVRSSWLFGVGGKNFVDTMLNLGRDHDEVVVVKDQIGSPTYTGHLADGLVRLLEWDLYGVRHMAADGQCSWYEFTIEIFAQAGVDCRVLSQTSDMLKRKAPRPAYSVLGTERDPALYLPDWKEGLAAFLAKRTEAWA